MTSANPCIHHSARAFGPVDGLRRVLCAVAGALSQAWGGLQSVTRASLLQAAREQRGEARHNGSRRLP